MRYNNYHKHDHKGNPWSLDVVVKEEDYCKRAVELGHTTVFTTNHGVQGDIFTWLDCSKRYGLKMIYGTEAYYVHDRIGKIKTGEDKDGNPTYGRDRSNRHIIIIARNNDGVMQLNDIMSEAHDTGFYYRPRIDDELLFSLNPNNFIVTSACVAGIWNDRELLLALNRHFGKHFFLEMQAHNTDFQKQVNTAMYEFSKASGIAMIHANDSHYILPEDTKYRDIFLKGKDRKYPEEDGMILDYPDDKTIINRYVRQGIFDKKQAEELLYNTLVFDDCSEITIINDDIKLPSVSQNPIDDLKRIINSRWLDERRNIPKSEWGKYLDAIRYEVDIVEKTNMANYFLIDYNVVKDGQEKYGGKLTNTGRGSAPSFYITKMLGLTDIDRVNAPITLFPTRFMSVERILGTRSLPDIDLNTADRTPFIKATEDLLGAENCAWMIAWKPLQDSSAFRVYCKGIGKNIAEYDDVAKDLDSYRDNPKWKKIIEESQRFVGVVESVSESPCFTEGTMVKTSSGYKPIEKIYVGDYVLTHNNRYKRVTNLSKKYSKIILELKCMGSVPIYTTPNHPFYVRHKNGREYIKCDGKYKSVRKFTNPEWIECKYLTKNDYVGHPVNDEKRIPEGDLPFDNKSFWWIVGRYIGDGWLRLTPGGRNHGSSYHTLICCNKNNSEDLDIEERLQDTFNYTKTEEATVYRYDISSKSFYMFLWQFGEYAYGKKITDTILNLPIDLLKAFIEGYVSADGYRLKDRNIISITTVSYELALGLQECIHKCYKIPTTLVKERKEDIKYSPLEDGRVIKAKHDVYILSYALYANYHTGFYDNGYMWMPVRNLKNIDNEKVVYNFSVEDDESYTVENIAVHNCSMLLYDKPVRKELGLIHTKEKICCLLDGYNCDKYKYLKNDYLSVTVWAIIKDTCELAGIPIPTIREIDNLLDAKTFDIYANGLTCTINQADSDFATGLVKQYKPQSVSEMSAFVAIIRPGCASLLDDFINRKPYTTGVEELDNILVEGKHRMIYQELIMKYLIWLGIEETGSYDIIKKIAKKKFKEKELADLKGKLLQGWLKRVGTEDGFIETWTVVEQAARYSFNASHSLSYAYDSLYGAYLKSHYPLEYYTTVLNYYADDNERTLKLINELKFFKIALKPIKFRHSSSKYSISKETNEIFKGIASIKYMNAQVADEMYELRNNKYNSFIDLLYDLSNKTTLNSRQLRILIELDFFDEFGDANYLMKLYEYFDYFNGRLQIKKDILEREGFNIDLVRSCAEKESPKMFTKLDSRKLLTIVAREIHCPKRTLKDKVQAQIDHLGYVDIVDDRYSGMACVVSLDTKYAPKLKMYSLKHGNTLDCKIDRKTFNKNKLKEGDIVMISGSRNKPKMKRNEDGEFVPVEGTTELWITSYKRINNI